MTVRKRWTNDEEQVLISQVRQHPNNLVRTFKETSELLERSEHSVRLHWYNNTRHNNIVFMTVGPKTKNINTKNTIHGKYDNTERVQLPIWRRILKLLGL